MSDTVNIHATSADGPDPGEVAWVARPGFAYAELVRERLRGVQVGFACGGVLALGFGAPGLVRVFRAGTNDERGLSAFVTSVIVLTAAIATRWLRRALAKRLGDPMVWSGRVVVPGPVFRRDVAIAIWTSFLFGGGAWLVGRLLGDRPDVPSAGACLAWAGVGMISCAVVATVLARTLDRWETQTGRTATMQLTSLTLGAIPTAGGLDQQT